MKKNRLGAICTILVVLLTLVQSITNVEAQTHDFMKIACEDTSENTPSNRVKENNLELIRETVSAKSQNLKQLLEMIEKYEWPAQEAYDRILTFLTYNTDYRTFFGGCYIDETKKLIINLTDCSPAVDRLFIDCANYQNVKIKRVQYSYMQLEEVYNSLKALKKTAIFPAMIEYSVDVMNNCISIVLANDDLRVRKAFFEYAKSCTEDFNIFHFTEGSEIRQFANMYAGGAVRISPSNLSGADYSLGYRGYRLNANGVPVYGFTSAGHLLSGENKMYKSTYLIGNLFEKVCSGNADISFFDKTSSTNVSNELAYYDNTGTFSTSMSLSTTEITYSTILVGRTIFKVGGSTFFTWGGIISIMSGLNNSIDDLLKTNAYASGGDSGGPGFIYTNNGYQIVGSVHGGPISSTEQNPITYFSQYLYNRDALSSIIFRY